MSLSLTCPKCNETFNVETNAVIPKEQDFHLKLGCESELFAAKTVGQAIVNMEKLLCSVAETVGDNVAVFIKSIDVQPGSVDIGFYITDIK